MTVRRRATPADEYTTVRSGALERTAARAGQKAAPPLEPLPLSPQQTQLWAVLQRQPRQTWTYRALAAETGFSEANLRHLIHVWVRAGSVVVGPRTARNVRLIRLAAAYRTLEGTH